MKSIIRIVLLLLITLNVLFSKELVDTSLQLKWKYQFQFAGFIMAKEKGFYEDVGLNVEIKEFTTGLNMYEEVQASNSDFAVGDSTIIYEFMKNTSLVAMMAIFQNSLYALITLKDSGIKNVQELQNKKIALGYKMNGITIQAMLKSNNIQFQDTLKDPNHYIQQFRNQKFDAMRVYLSNEPYLLQEQNITFNVIDPKDYGFTGYGDILFTSQKLINKEPQKVQKFYKASKQGWAYAFSNIEETIETILQHYNSQNKSRGALEYEAKVLKLISGYGKNFGELDHGRIQGLAQVLSYINIGKYDNEHFENSIYSYNRLESRHAKFSIFQYLQNINPLYFWMGIFSIGIIIIFIILWINILKQKNRELQNILDANITGMALFENDHCINMNKVGLTQIRYSLAEIQGKTFLDFIPASHHQKVSEQIKESLTPYETRLKKKDGSTFCVLTQSTIINSHRQITSFIDITALKHVQKDLESLTSSLEQKVQSEIEKNREQELMMLQQARLAQMGEVVNMIAHQWRQPLSVSKNLILLTSHLLSKQPTGNTDNQELIENLHQVSELITYMSQTISDFGSFFKPRKEKITFDLEEKLEESIKLLKSTLTSKGIKIHSNYTISSSLLGYPNELGQVIINIIKNSKDALIQRNQNKEKHIYLTLSKTLNNIQITIKDNAGGIDDAIINNVFDPYFSTKKKQDGTGIGLYMSKLIVEQHMGGLLSVKNDSDGAVFTIEFKID